MIGARAVLAALAIVMSPAAHAAANTEKAPAAPIKVALSDERTWFGGGIWMLGGVWDVDATIKCPGEEILGFWPLQQDCFGEITPVLASGTRSSYQTYYERKSNPPRIWVDGEAGWPEANFERLLRRSEPVITLNDVQYELVGFQEFARQKLAERTEDERKEVTKKRIDAVVAILVGAALLALAVFLLRKLYFLARRGAKRAKGAISEKVGEVVQASGRLRVQRVVEDEVIRQMTRTAIATATEDERAALRAQITNALESGDVALAKSKMSLLQKIEGD